MPTDLPIVHRHDDSRGAFVVEQDGERLAEMTWSGGNGTIIIDHTEVDEALRGQGVAVRLVETAVGWARATGKQIVPLCPFAKKTMDKHPEWNDVRRG